MTMQPGDALLTGQVDGRKVGQAAWSLAPTLPHEAPLPMPRFLARALFPQGFIPGRIPAVAPMAPPVTQPLIPPAGIQPPAPAANQVVTPPPAPPAQPAQPAARLPRDVSAHEPIRPTSQRIRITERKGM